MPQELRITIEGGLPLPDDAFAMATAISSAQTTIEALKTTIEQTLGGTVSVKAEVVTPRARKAGKEAAPVAPAAVAPVDAAASAVPAGRIAVFRASGELFSSYGKVENAAEQIIALVKEVTSEDELDALVSANDPSITDMPQAIRERIYAAAQDAEARIRAAAPLAA
jgi:hypothetical protein